MRIPADLLVRVRAQPEAEFALIVRVRGDLEAAAARLAAQGARVGHRLAFTHSLAVRATGRQVANLQLESWVEAIEEDKPARALH